MAEGDDRADFTSRLHGGVPFARFLGVEQVVGSGTELTGRLPWNPEQTTEVGTLHGGAMMALADVLGALLAFVNLPDGATGTTTISSASNFLRPGRGEFTRAVSRPLQVGGSTIVVQTDLFDSSGARLGRVTQTQAVLRPHQSRAAADQVVGRR